MRVILRLTAPVANMDPPMNPLVTTGNYVVSDPYAEATLVLYFQSLGHKAYTDTTPTILGHGLVHLDDVVDQSTFTSSLCTGRLARRAFESARLLSQAPETNPYSLLPFANLLLQRLLWVHSNLPWASPQ